MRLLAGIGGGLLVLLVLTDAFSTIILARRTRHSFRITRAFYALTWRPYAAIARRMHSGRKRESVLSVYGPLSLLLILGLWAIGLIVGFAMVQWSVNMQLDLEPGSSLNDLYYSATTLFTLETGRPRNVVSKIVTVMEGGFGIAFLGLIISYLPTFYQAFSQRERQISQLDARAGSPPSAGGILQLDVSKPASIERLLELWEGWEAELLDAQIAFPMLAWFRSQHANQSWLTALTLMVDCAAVISLCAEQDLKRQAEYTFAMGRHALADTSAIFRMKPSTTREDRLPHDQFLELGKCIGQTGTPLGKRGGPEGTSLSQFPIRSANRTCERKTPAS